MLSSASVGRGVVIAVNEDFRTFIAKKSLTSQDRERTGEMLRAGDREKGYLRGRRSHPPVRSSC
jgi:hypothetical protein